MISDSKMNAKLAQDTTIQAKNSNITWKQRICNRIFDRIEARAKDGNFECSVLESEIGVELTPMILDMVKNLGFSVTKKKSVIRIGWHLTSV